MEGLVHRTGRSQVISHLGLRPGDRVLDVGCGTGLSLPMLGQAVGEDGVAATCDSPWACTVGRGKPLAGDRGLGPPVFAVLHHSRSVRTSVRISRSPMPGRTLHHDRTQCCSP
ncbi:class I SAM-dependent methyltransferase [Leekyejoonella antrihumi]